VVETVFTYLIVILGCINAIRMAAYFILADIYDLVSLVKPHPGLNYRPFVSVVVAAYNEEKAIIKTLNSIIFGSNYSNFEVIVVDDGSKDKTYRLVQDYIHEYQIEKIRLIRQENGGKATALNNGIKNYAKGEIIMCLDADSLLANDAISKAVKYFADDKVAAVASNVRIIQSHTLLGVIQYIEYLMGHRLKRAYTVLNNEYIIGGIGSTFRKSVLENVNYYDTDTITEDIDLTMKILNKGNKNTKVIFASDIVCFTQSVVSLKDLYKQRYRWKYGRFQTLFKNKNMFFNFSKKYTKLLTFIQLPFVLYSEFSFLIDPLLIGFLLYLTLRYHETSSALGVFVFLGFYTAVTIFTDEYLTLKEKCVSLLYAPFAYMFFFIISIVEYKALIQSIINIKGILKAREINQCGWEHVART
jgi:cellulose synthase/poly-beta-1,6-N-acetylglucosamine synthase-like glycosyltransferase